MHTRYAPTRPEDQPLPFRCNQAVRTELIGSDTARAHGITVVAFTPILVLCRRLIDAGINPTTPLAAFRGEMLCLTVRHIGEGARLTVKTTGNGAPRFALDGHCRGATASPVRQNEITPSFHPNPFAHDAGFLPLSHRHDSLAAG